MNKKKKRTEREGETIERERGKRRGKHQALRINLLDFNSSVEVGYGFYTIRSKLLIANDMYWVVL